MSSAPGHAPRPASSESQRSTPALRLTAASGRSAPRSAAAICHRCPCQRSVALPSGLAPSSSKQDREPWMYVRRRSAATPGSRVAWNMPPFSKRPLTSSGSPGSISSVAPREHLDDLAAESAQHRPRRIQAVGFARGGDPALDQQQPEGRVGSQQVRQPRRPPGATPPSARAGAAFSYRPGSAPPRRRCPAFPRWGGRTPPPAPTARPAAVARRRPPPRPPR